MCFFIKFINNNISCSPKYNYKSFKMTCLMNNEKVMSLNSLSLLLLLHSLGLFVVPAQILLFHQRRRPYLSSPMLFWSPKSFRMTCLINNEKLMNLGSLGLLLPLLSLESALSKCLIFATFSFHQQWHLNLSKAQW